MEFFIQSTNFVVYHINKILKENFKTFTLRIYGTEKLGKCDHPFVIVLRDETTDHMLIKLNQFLFQHKKSSVQIFNPKKQIYFKTERLLMDCLNELYLNFEISDTKIILFTNSDGKRYVFAEIQIANPIKISQILFRNYDSSSNTFTVQIRNLGKF